MDVAEEDLTCGECGGESFVPKSKNPFVGFRSIEHYSCFIRSLPLRLSHGIETVDQFLEIIYYVRATAYLVERL